jgi:hypothetical protein
MKMTDLLQQIQESLRQEEFSLTLHAQQQITARRIKVAEIRTALLSDNAEVIEDYPEDPRGSSCLVYGKIGEKVLHIHISHPPEIVVITAYEPDPDRWTLDLKQRK